MEMTETMETTGGVGLAEASVGADAGSGTGATAFKGRSLCLYHPNRGGTGSAMRLEPRLNRDDRDNYNCFFLEMAGQKAGRGGAGAGREAARFDWERKITVRLDFQDVAEMLAVLEGQAPRVGGRNGLFHQTGQGNTLIGFQARTEGEGFYLSLSAKRQGEARKVGIVLGRAEATGVRCLLQTGLFFITFPGVFRRDRRGGGAARGQGGEGR